MLLIAPLLQAVHAPLSSGRHRPRASALRMASELENPYLSEMLKTAQRITRRGHGILAADESVPTIGKRLETIGVENTEVSRRAFRELLFSTPGLGQHISGAILYDETLYQRTAGGVRFTTLLQQEGIEVGIKVDTGLAQLPGKRGETATQGLDGLGARCAVYYAEGARFAKWRAVFHMRDDGPSERALSTNVEALARYASICQEHGLVPIVEPEITLGPGDYGLEVAARECERVLSHVFRALNAHEVVLEATLLKPAMVLPGLDAPLPENDAAEVARLTVRSLMRTVPPALPGIHFLSGGMGAEEATSNLQQVNLYRQRACESAPWSLSFSYGRALQDGVIKAWAGEPENIPIAQELLLELARVNAEASVGEWNEEHPSPGGKRLALVPKFSYSSERRQPENLFNW